MAAQILIPASIQLDIREVLLSLVQDAHEEMDGGLVSQGRELHPEWFAPARRKLNCIWPLIDSLGWGTPAEAKDIEIMFTGSVLALVREGIEDHLVHYETWLKEADLTDAWRVNNGLPPKKEETVRRAKDLEAFLASLLV